MALLRSTLTSVDSLHVNLPSTRLKELLDESYLRRWMSLSGAWNTPVEVTSKVLLENILKQRIESPLSELQLLH